MNKSETVGNRGAIDTEVIIPDEVLPAGVIPTRHNDSMPIGFVPHEPVPVGFVLSHVLTVKDRMISDSDSRKFLRNTRRLQYKFGRDAVLGTTNTAQGWSHIEGAISNAVFVRHDAKPLPMRSRISRAVSRKVFGLKCDVNF